MMAIVADILVVATIMAVVIITAAITTAITSAITIITTMISIGERRDFCLELPLALPCIRRRLTATASLVITISLPCVVMNDT